MPFLRLLTGLVRAILWTILGVNLLAALLVALAPSPGDIPFVPLDLDAPIGRTTHAKLAALADDGPHCRALLARAGVRVRPLPRQPGAGDCPLENVIVPQGRALSLRPQGPRLACPLAAALLLWEHQVVQPAARATLGSDVATIRHLGSYNCRRINGDAQGAWSQHAAARAIDVAAFTLADGRTISVARDWHAKDPRAAFLRQIRYGGCRLFSTTLSPDYNAAHRDHFHLDMGRGWAGFCA